MASGKLFKPSSSRLPRGTLTAARLLTTEPFALHDRLQASIQRSSYLRHHVEGLRYKISRLDEHISKLRAAVRLAELNTESPAAQQVEQSHYLVEQQLALERRAEQVDAVIQLVESLRGDAASEMTDRALNWLSATRAALPQQITEQQTQIDQWLEPVGQQPPQMQTAFKQYLHGYREIATEKQPLLRELEISEAQLALDQVSFAVPVDSTQLTEFTLDEIASLRAGKLSDPVRERLTQASIEAVSITPQPLNEVTNLFTVLDRQGQAHMLAVTLIHYVAAENGGESDEQTVRLLSNKLLNSSEIIRVVAVNRLSLGGKFSVYFDRWREFLTENPRDNTEGGVFPAIWGTVVMTLIMTIAVVPFGVMAALYLREYTHAGPLVSLIRISINNLAGVPSIVYGVFGFSFFCYLIGAYIDGGPKNANVIPLPSAAWFASMSVTAVVGTSAFLLSFFGSGPAHTQTATKRWFSKIALVLWIACVAAMAYLLLKSPFFDGFYREYLPNPTFGKGGLLWAALTLSLLTLPVVIVATEEALAAVPNSLREGSLACGASKWQTIRRIILPHARPGILTGAILAMARGAGEVAPLMLVGALPSAPDLPLDNEFPFFHGSRSFMHLGYQIYTLGFQSPNSEAAKPMVFTCTLLLILIVAALNISAIYLRARLKRRFQGNQF
ncbi:MAG: ABC transporter permease subunit [Pirellulaceae bacterium]